MWRRNHHPAFWIVFLHASLGPARPFRRFHRVIACALLLLVCGSVAAEPIKKSAKTTAVHPSKPIKKSAKTTAIHPFAPPKEVKTAPKGPPANQLFGGVAAPAPLAARAIGSYAKGCLAGAVSLPINGPTWQVMRLSRDRNWGHPRLLDFLERFAADVSKRRRILSPSSSHSDHLTYEKVSLRSSWWTLTYSSHLWLLKSFFNGEAHLLRY